MSHRKQLPDGWHWTTFGKVAKQQKEKVDPESGDLERYIAGEHMDTDDLKLRRWGIIDDGYLGPAFHRGFRKGEILYGSRRTYLRKVAVADFDGICANTTFVIKARPDAIYPDLLPFVMQSEGFTQHSIRNSKGSVNPYVNWKDIASYKFPLPPMEEQRRLAEILWSVEETIEHYTQVEQSIDALLWSKFHQLVNETEYPDEPLGYCIVPNGENSTYPHQEPIYLGLEHMETGEWTVSQFDDSEQYTSNCHKFKAGDLLYGKLRPYLDKCAIATFDGVCSTEILVLQPTEKVIVEYLMYHFHSQPFISYNDVRSYGTKMPRTSLDIIVKYSIPVPPIEVQKQMVETLDAIRLQKTEIRAQIERLKALKERAISVRLGQ